MATISNTPRPGYVWDSTDNVWYPIGVGNHNHSEIAKTIVDAKGDLIVGTANDTVARQAVGTDGQMLVADSTQTNGIGWASQPFVAGKNKIINGDFNIWQRGTSFTTNGVYTADRWRIDWIGSTPTTWSVSQQAFTAGTAPVAGYESQYYSQISVTTAGSTTAGYYYQRIEDVRTFANQTVTYSFWAKADSARTITIYPYQSFPATDWTGTGQNVTLSTSWARYSVTFTMPSIAGKTIGAGSFMAALISWSVASGAVYSTWGHQLESGSIVTPFTTSTGTIQGELAACQRYYYRLANAGASGNYGIGYAYSTTSVANGLRSPVTMRITPTVLDYATIELTIVGVANYAITGLAIDAGTSGPDYVTLLATGATGLTTNRPYSLKNASSTAGYIGLSSEL